MNIKVEGHPDLVKDPRSGAVINTNVQDMQTARMRKERMKAKNNRIEQLESDVTEIKGMLEKILSKL